MTAQERKVEAARVARLAIGQRTIPNGHLIEATRIDRSNPQLILVTFAGSGLRPFREACYTAKEVLSMIGAR